MVRDYVRKRSRTNIEVLYLYEEMRHTLIEIQNGESENIAYERFGKRIGLLPYMKFSTMLSQNLRKGNRQLIDQLKLTSLDALQHRREVMKRRGEETSSRLLMPMMVQFLLILIVVLYPAMSTI